MKRELIVATEPIQDRKDKSLWFCDVINGGTRVARVSSPNDVECLKFAQLFSAAPELLAAAKQAVFALADDENGRDELLNDAEKKAVKMLRIAIEKAENHKN